VPTDEPDELTDTVRRETEKAVENVRRQRGELYEIEHAAEDAGEEQDDPAAELGGSGVEPGRSLRGTGRAS
jgi:hypothetical protein